MYKRDFTKFQELFQRIGKSIHRLFKKKGKTETEENIQTITEQEK